MISQAYILRDLGISEKEIKNIFPKMKEVNNENLEKFIFVQSQLQGITKTDHFELEVLK